MTTKGPGVITLNAEPPGATKLHRYRKDRFGARF